VGVIQVLVDTSDESSGGSLSLLEVSLSFSGEGLGETSLGLKGKLSSVFVVFIGLLVHSSNSGVVGVKDIHGSNVLQWVLLLLGVERSVSSLVSQNALNGIRVDDLGNIGVGQDGSVEVIA